MSQQCIFTSSSLVSPARPLALDLPKLGYRETTGTVLIFDLSDSQTVSATTIVRVATNMIPKGRISLAVEPHTARLERKIQGFFFYIFSNNCKKMCIEVGMTCNKVCKQGRDASDTISDTYESREQTTWSAWRAVAELQTRWISPANCRGPQI